MPLQSKVVDVAVRAGVHVATVRPVLPNGASAAPEPRPVTGTAADDLGGPPGKDGFASPTAGRTDIIALLVDDPADPFWSCIIRGAEEVARQHGHLTVVGSTGGRSERELHLLRDVVRRRVSGLLLAPVTHERVGRHRALTRRAPVVYIDRASDDCPGDSVLLDNFGGTRQAVDHLLDRGHRRIAYIGGDSSAAPIDERLAGYRRALEDGGLRVDPALIRLDSGGIESARDAALDLLSEPGAATAIFADSYHASVGVLDAVRGRPDVDVAGFGDLDFADLLPRSVALVTYDAAEVGRRAAQLLFQRIDGGTGPLIRVFLPTALAVRGGRTGN